MYNVYFLPVFGLLFYFLNIFFEERIVLNFDGLQFIFFFFFLIVCALCSLRNLCLFQGFSTSAHLTFGLDKSLLWGPSLVLMRAPLVSPIRCQEQPFPHLWQTIMSSDILNDPRGWGGGKITSTWEQLVYSKVKNILSYVCFWKFYSFNFMFSPVINFAS